MVVVKKQRVGARCLHAVCGNGGERVLQYQVRRLILYCMRRYWEGMSDDAYFMLIVSRAPQESLVSGYVSKWQMELLIAAPGASNLQLKVALFQEGPRTSALACPVWNH